jgi:hypothetical protein
LLLVPDMSMMWALLLYAPVSTYELHGDTSMKNLS